MSLPDPEAIATELVDRAKQDFRPVDPERVAALWPELRVSCDKLEKEGYLIDLGAQGGEIIVREGDPLPRRRYTIAHELGHWVLRTSGFSEVGHAHDSAYKPVERWCDQFASALLMPREWVVGDFREAKVGGLIHTIRSGPHLYQVSHQSFRLRVSQITPISIFEVEQNGHMIEPRWKYEARGVPTKTVGDTLSQALALVREKSDYGRHLHRKTQFLSVCAQISHGGESRRWLICILPKPKPQVRKADEAVGAGEMS